MMLGKTSLKMVSQEVVQTEFSVVHGLTRMHGLTRNEETWLGQRKFEKYRDTVHKYHIER